jgi:phage terminase large subunit-like protein
MFPIEKIEIVPARPVVSDVVSAARYWDKAGTAGGGAYSSGVLMARMRDGTFTVVDVRRGQWSALDRERMIKQTAEIDHGLYPTTKVWVEQEPGSGGKESAEASVRMLAGFSAAADRVSGSKEVRADPFLPSGRLEILNSCKPTGTEIILTSTSTSRLVSMPIRWTHHPAHSTRSRRSIDMTRL